MDRELCLVKGKSEVSLLCIWLNRTSFPKIRNSRPQFRFPLPIFHAPLYKYAVNCRLRLFFEKSRAVLEVICSRAYVYPSDPGGGGVGSIAKLQSPPAALFPFFMAEKYQVSLLRKAFSSEARTFYGKTKALLHFSSPWLIW